MFLLDAPDILPDTQTITVLAQAKQPRNYAEDPERIVGTCQFIENPIRHSPEGKIYKNIASIFPVGAAESYLLKYAKLKDYSLEDRIAAKTTILEQPKHGKLIKKESKIGDRFQYLPDTNFHGEDSLVVLVEIRGIKVKVLQLLQVNGPYEIEEESCHGKNQAEMIWKISSTTGTEGEISLTLIEILDSDIKQEEAQT